MSWNGKDELKLSIQERGFTLNVDGRTVPGVYWTPAEGTSDRLVLLGHGGTTHKKVEYIEQVAMLLVGKGISAMAIDGPGHGERATTTNGTGRHGCGSGGLPPHVARRWRHQTV